MVTVHIYAPPGVVWGYKDGTRPICGEPVRYECHIYEWVDPEDIVTGECEHVQRLNCPWGKAAIRLRRQMQGPGWIETGAELPWLKGIPQ